MQYDNFDVTIVPEGGRDYRIVVRSPAGETHATMRLPLDEVAVDRYLTKLQNALLRSSGLRRRIPSPQEQSVQEFGQLLFNALFAGDVRSLYDQSQKEAGLHEMGLRLRLRIQAPELAALPWEYLYDQRQADYLCLSSSTPLVRYVELTQSLRPLKVKPPLSILGMIASPKDMEPLDVEREKERMQLALKNQEQQGLVELVWLEGQTWRDLHEALLSRQWHVFHFIGHGGFHAPSDEGVLALATEDGKSHQLKATQIGRLLANHPSLRLVVLNACEGARGGQHDIFSSTAAILAQRGIPAVLAMQEEISDRAAIEFARTFYQMLANGRPVDAAVAEARLAISMEIPDSLEWGTPVLYLRSTDGLLFDIAERTLPLENEPAVSPRPQEGSRGQSSKDAEPDGISPGKDIDSRAARKERQWDEASFFADLEHRRGGVEASVTRKILDWARSRNLRIWWGKGLQYGSFFPMLDHTNDTYWTVAVWTYGRVEIQFQWMLPKPPFDDEAKRLELLGRLNQLPGVSLSPIVITRRPSIPVAIFKDEAALNLFLQTLDWMVQVVRGGTDEMNNVEG